MQNIKLCSSTGKCYNFPENYVPRRKPRIKNSKPAEKVNKAPSNGGEETVKKIPAVLPYEAQQALLRSHRNLDLDETVEHKKEQQKLADHFLYGNHPVVEYQLSDGSKGNLNKTPRK